MASAGLLRNSRTGSLVPATSRSGRAEMARRNSSDLNRLSR